MGDGVRGGVKVYRGSAGAARTYVEADRSRVDDYYLAEGTGLADRHVAVSAAGEAAGRGRAGVHPGGVMDGDTYEAWVAGRVVTKGVATGVAKGRLRTDGQAVRFVEVVINGPKTWSLAASVHPEISAAYDAAQGRAAGEVIGWLAEHATTRVGPRGRQVQVPVEELEAAVVRHHTSRAGDPHRHLHLQVNARVWARGAWRGLHTVGVRDSLDAINGIGQAAMQCDPEFRAVLRRHGYTLNAATGEIEQLKRFAPTFSARAAQIARNVDRYEARWRSEHPGQEPGPRLRQAWNTRAWAQARPDKVVPRDGAELRQRWLEELTDLGFQPPTPPHTSAGAPGVSGRGGGAIAEPEPVVVGPRIGQLHRDAFVGVALIRLGAKRSGWNAADVRGELERLVAATGLVAEPAARVELVEDLTARTLNACVPLLHRVDVPEHIRALTSASVLSVEGELVTRFAHRAHNTAATAGSQPGHAVIGAEGLDVAQQRVAAELVGGSALLVIEGAAGAGKTSTLAAVQRSLEAVGRSRMVVVTPTLKAAEVAAREVGTGAFSAAWLAYQHGFRWDADGHWTRLPAEQRDTSPGARLLPGDLLVVDEAGMLDQDTALALTTLADEAGARIALIGDRHQLPAVGRGGVLDLAIDAAPEHACLSLESVHRFVDPDYADLTLAMRTGQDPAAVFDALHARGEIRIHPSEVERLQHLTHLASTTAASNTGRPLIVADTREHVTALNAAIRDHILAPQTAGPFEHAETGSRSLRALTTESGERIGVGDTITTRRNDRSLGVANRQTWTVTALSADGSLTIAPQSATRSASNGRTPGGTAPEPGGGAPGGTERGRRQGRRVKPQVSTGGRTLPNDYARSHVELAYARTVYGAQGETVHAAHFVAGEQTGAAGAYVAMTRGREHNTAHMVAESVEDAREQWVGVFARDRADLGPGHAAERAAEDLERYGSLDWETAEALAITKDTSSGTGHLRAQHLDRTASGPGQVRQGPSR